MFIEHELFVYKQLPSGNPLAQVLRPMKRRIGGPP